MNYIELESSGTLRELLNPSLSFLRHFGLFTLQFNTV
jgi:hypothetical protein